MLRDFKWQRLIFIYVFNTLLNLFKRKYISFLSAFVWNDITACSHYSSFDTGNSQRTLRSALNIRAHGTGSGVTVHRFWKMPEVSHHADRSRKHSSSVAFASLHRAWSQTQHLHWDSASQFKMKAPAHTRDKVSLFKKDHLTASWATKHELNTLLWQVRCDRSSAGSVLVALVFRLAHCHLQMLWLDVRPDDITLTCNCGHTRHISVLAFFFFVPIKQRSQPQTEMFLFCFVSKMIFKEKLQLLYICVDVRNRPFEIHGIVTAQFTHACPLLLYTELVFLTYVWIPTNCRRA